MNRQSPQTPGPDDDDFDSAGRRLCGFNPHANPHTATCEQDPALPDRCVWCRRQAKPGELGTTTDAGRAKRRLLDRDPSSRAALPFVACQLCGDRVAPEAWERHLVGHHRGEIKTRPVAEAFERMTTAYRGNTTELLADSPRVVVA